MTNSKIFLLSCISFIVGIGIYNVFSKTESIYYFSISVLFLVATIIFWKNKKYRIVGLMGLFLFLGIWRYGTSISVNSPDKISYYNGEEVVFDGVVANEPALRSKSQRLEVKIPGTRSLEASRLRVPGIGKVLVTTSLYPQYNYGDILEIKCKLKTPEQFNDFAYDKYLARFDIYSVCYSDEVYLIGKKENIFINLKNKIYSFKSKMSEVINLGLPKPESDIASAMVLGIKKDIPSDLRESFSRAGLSHIIAISGMHIGILTVMLQLFLLRLCINRRKAFWVVAGFLFLYIILIGAPASAVRASVMGLLALWAYNNGRLKNIFNPLVFVATLMLFINPKLFRDDIGFQLSFLAVLGIAIFYPIFKEKLIEKIDLKPLKLIAEIFALTISAQIFTMPIVAVNFGVVSLVAPISNLLVLWLLPVLLIAIILGIFLSLIIPSLATIFFLPSFVILKFIIFVAESLMSIPFAYLVV